MPAHIRWIWFSLLWLFPVTGFTQGKTGVGGMVQNRKGNPIPSVHVHLKNDRVGTITDINGIFFLPTPSDDTVYVVFSSVGFKPVIRKIYVPPEKIQQVTIVLTPSINSIREVQIQGTRHEEGTMRKIDIKDLNTLPTPTGSIESLIKTLPGVSSQNELSSQYSVRGGNFDENLVYINDIEIYRPFLVRSGQQEGLSIINPDLVENVSFSAGGFAPRYGDRMSSVLDITYRTPVSFKGTVSAGLLGATAHVEGISRNRKFTYLAGVRYKSNSYLLNTLETEGEYKPRFGDMQVLLTYKINEKVSLEGLGNISLNRYHFIPSSRKTSFGTVQDAIALYVYYEGQEKDVFDTYLGAFTVNYYPFPKMRMKWIAAAFSTLEEENYDIHGYYSLNALDKQLGSETFGDSIMNIGIGSFLDHARNRLHGNLYSLKYLGAYNPGHQYLQWGVTVKAEQFNDRIREWTLRDSAGYSLPYDGKTVNLFHSTIASNLMNTWRITGFIENQRTWYIDSVVLRLQGGVRFNFWSFSRQLVVSPRLLFTYRPTPRSVWSYHLSAGSYDQPPLYKEARHPDGSVNPGIKAQRSWHIVAGTDYRFRAWNRPFLWTAEAYYKGMYNLIPYFMENVRIDYVGENIARGSAYGLDLKINGEFVRGVDSWASLSFMRACEDVTGDSYTDKDGRTRFPGCYPRPTDQLINFGLSFQDYFPNNPSFRMHLALFYSTGLPVRPPNTERYDLFFRMPAYQRVDLGFSKDFVKTKTGENEKLSKHIRSMRIGLDIFNLFGNNNVSSYMWVNTVNNLSHETGWYAVPNYLTGRRINIRLVIGF